MATQNSQVAVTRWNGSQHPTTSAITRQMKSEGLRPYTWDNGANYRYAIRSHNYDKVLYVVKGNLEISFPASNSRVRLRTGDRIDIPAGIRHGTIIGSNGAQCIEASLKRTRTSS